MPKTVSVCSNCSKQHSSWCKSSQCEHDIKPIFEYTFYNNDNGISGGRLNFIINITCSKCNYIIASYIEDWKFR